MTAPTRPVLVTAPVTGSQGQPVKLAIAVVVEQGSVLQSVEISGVPSGFVLTSATKGKEHRPGFFQWTVSSAASLNSVFLTPVAATSAPTGGFTLAVVASVVRPGLSDVACAVGFVDVMVLPDPANLRVGLTPLPAVSVVDTEDRYHYQVVHRPLSRSQAVVVQVSAKNDAHVALLTTPDGSGEYYEAVIGGWGGSRCALRRRAASATTTREQLFELPGLLEPTTNAGTAWSVVRANSGDPALVGLDANISGAVWGWTATGRMFVRAGAGPTDPTGTGWTPVEGSSPMVTIDDAGIAWSLDQSGCVWRREEVTPAKPAGTHWTQVDNKSFRTISAGAKGQVWGVTSDNRLFVRIGVTDAAPGGTSWQEVPGIPIGSVSCAGSQVWVIDAKGGSGVWVRIGVSPSTPAGTDWRWLENGPDQLAGDVSGRLWGRQRDGQLAVRTGMSTAAPWGTGWRTADPRPLRALTGTALGAWAIGADGLILYRMGADAPTYWVALTDGILQLGRGNRVGRDVLATMDDSAAPLRAVRAGVSTGFGSTGHWRVTIPGRVPMAGRVVDQTAGPGITLAIGSASPQTTLATPDQYAYQILPKPVAGPVSCFFQVSARNDAHIGLFCGQPPPTGDEQYYELVFGGWGNTQSALRRRSASTVLHEQLLPTAHLVSGDRPVDASDTYWVAFDQGRVRAGHGSTMDTPFLSWQDPTPLRISNIGVTTGFGATGQWRVTPVGQVPGTGTGATSFGGPPFLRRGGDTFWLSASRGFSPGPARGFQLVVLDRATAGPGASSTYDTVDPAQAAALAAALDRLGPDKIVVLVAGSVIGMTADLATAMKRCGAGSALARLPTPAAGATAGAWHYAFAGIPGSGEDAGFEDVHAPAENTMASLSLRLVNGVLEIDRGDPLTSSKPLAGAWKATQVIVSGVPQGASLSAGQKLDTAANQTTLWAVPVASMDALAVDLADNTQQTVQLSATVATSQTLGPVDLTAVASTDLSASYFSDGLNAAATVNASASSSAGASVTLPGGGILNTSVSLAAAAGATVGGGAGSSTWFDCPNCKGVGQVQGSAGLEDCSRCNGKGKITAPGVTARVYAGALVTVEHNTSYEQQVGGGVSIAAAGSMTVKAGASIAGDGDLYAGSGRYGAKGSVDTYAGASLEATATMGGNAYGSSAAVSSSASGPGAVGIGGGGTATIDGSKITLGLSGALGVELFGVEFDLEFTVDTGPLQNLVVAAYDRGIAQATTTVVSGGRDAVRWCEGAGGYVARTAAGAVAWGEGAAADAAAFFEHDVTGAFTPVGTFTVDTARQVSAVAQVAGAGFVSAGTTIGNTVVDVGSAAYNAAASEVRSLITGAEGLVTSIEGWFDSISDFFASLGGHHSSEPRNVNDSPGALTTGAVRLYETWGYWNAQQDFPIGSYDLPATRNDDQHVRSANVSSVRIPVDRRLRVYPMAGFGGSPILLIADAPLLWQLNGSVSSVIVTALRPEARQSVATGWNGIGFTGSSQTFAVGQTDGDAINRGSVGNDRMISIQIPPGLAVTLFSEEHFAGNRITLVEDTREFWSMNDGVRSIRVEAV